MTQNKAMAEAKVRLDNGDVVGLPTETVYGLAARIDIPGAIEKIFLTKERPFFDPLIVHVASVSQAQELTTQWGDVEQILTEAFWPGPLTLVLPKAPTVNNMITAGLTSVGIRMPKHNVALDLIREVGVPLAAPSANKFGKTSPTSARHVRKEFQNEDVFVLEGGDCEIGIESTVLLVRKQSGHPSELAILRRGHILQTEIESLLKSEGIEFNFIEQIDKGASPGQMKHHYMPPVPFVICHELQRSSASILQEVNEKLQQLPDVIESVKIMKPSGGIHNASILNLSKDPVLAAREFYGKLRDCAEQGSGCIIFYKDPSQVGERWESLFDRMNKAASIIL